ncbi:MAG: hypothetical protein CL561_03880 [Alphaproteobacteria bacterium]|nr:hypothetical protein [Alphaproteobacteria bacterium]|tara:strand:- start:1320 stop:1964 length:645 start_codon:yes stop_codon:yes gene_type:complete
MRILFLALLGMGLTIPHIVQARPVSYPGGWTVMSMNNGEVNSAHIHYSPTAKTSVGYKFEYWRDKDFTLNAVQMNNLLKRWNEKDSQANLYLKSGIGVAHSNADDTDGETSGAGFTGMAADWENRRFFISYENRYTEAGDIDDFYQQSARVGVTPYIGDYGDLHTWLMLDVQHSPENEDHFTVTPLVRFFKGVHLLEAGMNNHGEVLFNYVFRY